MGPVTKHSASMTGRARYSLLIQGDDSSQQWDKGKVIQSFQQIPARLLVKSNSYTPDFLAINAEPLFRQILVTCVLTFLKCQLKSVSPCHFVFVTGSLYFRHNPILSYI